MGIALSERLSLIIDAKADRAVEELKKPAASAAQLAVEEDKAALSAARLEAANDKLAVSAERVSLAEAKAAGDNERIAASNNALAGSQNKAAISKARSAVAADKLAVDEARAAAATKGLGTEASSAGGLLDSMGLSGLTAAGTLSTLAPIAAVVGGALAFKTVDEGLHKFEHLGTVVYGVQSIMGGTARQSSLLVGQLQQLNIEPEIAAKAMARLGAAIGDGSSKLGQYGVQVKLNANGTTDLYGTLDNLRNAYNSSADAATRDAIAKQLGLRNATALIPLLRLTNEQVAELNRQTAASGGVLSEEDPKRAHEMEVSSKQIKQAWDNLEIGLAKDFVPALITGEHALRDILDLSNKIHLGKTLVDASPFGQLAAVGKAATDGFGLTPLLKTAGSVFDEVTGKTKAHTDAAKDDASANQDDSSSMDTVAEVAEKLSSALTGVISARNGVVDAQSAYVDAQNREIDSQTALDQLVAKGPVDQEKLTSAKDAYASASESVTRAVESEEQATQRLNQAKQKATALDLAEARNKIDLAADQKIASEAAVQQAQEKLDQLLGGGSASAGEIAAARAELKTRQDEVTRSVIDQSKASDDLVTLQQKGTDSDQKVVDAAHGVRDARRGVSDALDQQRKAHDKLVEAEKPDPEFQHKLREATQSVAEAHQSVKEAADNETTAALTAKTANDQLATSLGSNAAAIKSVRIELGLLQDQGFPVDLLQTLLNAGEQYGPAGGSPGFETAPTTVTPTHRALGGPLNPDGDYLVGDNGPELLRMGRSSGGTAVPLAGAGVPSGPLLVQKFYGYDTRWVSQRAARDLTLSLSSVLPPRIGAPA